MATGDWRCDRHLYCMRRFTHCPEVAVAVTDTDDSRVHWADSRTWSSEFIANLPFRR